MPDLRNEFVEKAITQKPRKVSYERPLSQYHPPSALEATMLTNIRILKDRACSDAMPNGARRVISAASRVPNPDGAIGINARTPVRVKTDTSIDISVAIPTDRASRTAHVK